MTRAPFQSSWSVWTSANLTQCFAYPARLPIASAIQVTLTIMACDDISPAKFWLCYLKALKFVFVVWSWPDFSKWCKAGHLNGKESEILWPLSAGFFKVLSRGSWLCAPLLSGPVSWGNCGQLQSNWAECCNPLNGWIISKAHIAWCSAWLIMTNLLTLSANCCCLDNSNPLAMLFVRSFCPNRQFLFMWEHSENVSHLISLIYLWTEVGGLILCKNFISLWGKYDKYVWSSIM